VTETHQLTDTGESAEEFLRRLSGRPAPRSAGPASGRPVRPRPSIPGYEPESRPWLPASASLILWGTGQWANGQRSLGLLFLSLEALAVALVYGLSASWGSCVRLAALFEIEELDLAVALFFAGFAIPLAGLAGVLQAYTHAARFGRPEPLGGPGLVPCAASALVPGWGQMLLAQPGKAAMFLATWSLGLTVLAVGWRWPGFWSAFDGTPRAITSVPLTLAQLAAALVVALAWVVAVYDALVTAHRR
jgi:hypothetical protein